MELGKVRLMRDFIKENALVQSKRGYTKEQESVIKEQLERLLSSRNSDRSSQVRQSKEVKEKKEFEYKVKNVVLDKGDDAEVFHSREISREEIGNIKDGFFRLFRRSQGDMTETDPSVKRKLSSSVAEQYTRPNSIAKIMRSTSQKKLKQKGKVINAGASRYDSREDDFETDPEFVLYDERLPTKEDKVGKQKGGLGSIGEILETKKEYVTTHEESQGETQLKLFQEASQRRKNRTKWMNYFNNMKIDEGSRESLLANVDVENMKEKEKLNTEEKLKEEGNKDQGKSKRKGKTTTLWRIKGDGMREVVKLLENHQRGYSEDNGTQISKVMGNLREIQNLKRLNIQPRNRRDITIQSQSVSEWPKDLLRSKQGVIKEINPLGQSWKAETREERPFTALNLGIK